MNTDDNLDSHDTPDLGHHQHRHQPGVVAREYGALATICGRNADYAANLDRHWFEAHPGTDSYVRPAIAHEFCEFLRNLYGIDAVCAETTMTEVIQVSPGVRTRRAATAVFVVMDEVVA